jgi:hypothetical protein
VNIVNEALEIMGWKQQMLGNYLKMHRSYISQMATGKRDIQPRTQELLRHLIDTAGGKLNECSLDENPVHSAREAIAANELKNAKDDIQRAMKRIERAEECLGLSGVNYGSLGREHSASTVVVDDTSSKFKPGVVHDRTC